MIHQVKPHYPIYIPSKGRFENCYTARCLQADGVKFKLVVEPQEAEEYAKRFGERNILELPFRDKGLITTRNWIKNFSRTVGAFRHWQLDDNIMRFMRAYKGKRIHCSAGIALRVCEDFADRYCNVAIAGLNYVMFYTGHDPYIPPFYRNCRVYSCSLILNQIEETWRSYFNDDTDICLQVLSAGWCTVLLNAFLIKKKTTMTVKGGNTPHYQGDGRLKMARSLERLWPGVVTTKRRFHRPQHVVKDSWRKFDTALILKPNVNLERMKAVEEYGMGLELVSSTTSPALKKIYREWRKHAKARRQQND